MGMTADTLETVMSAKELTEHFADMTLDAREVKAAREKAEKQAKAQRSSSQPRRRR